MGLSLPLFLSWRDGDMMAGAEAAILDAEPVEPINSIGDVWGLCCREPHWTHRWTTLSRPGQKEGESNVLFQPLVSSGLSDSVTHGQI